MKFLIFAFLLALPSVALSQEITLSGTMHRSTLEGGCWYLQSSTGKRYELTGDTGLLRELRIEGQHIAIDAMPLKNAASVCMIGEIVHVLRRVDTIRQPIDLPIMTLTIDGTIHRTKSGIWYVKLPPFRSREREFEFQTEPPPAARHIGAHLHGTFRVIVSRSVTRENMDGQILPSSTPDPRTKVTLQRKHDTR